LNKHYRYILHETREKEKIIEKREAIFLLYEIIDGAAATTTSVVVIISKSFGQVAFLGGTGTIIRCIVVRTTD